MHKYSISLYIRYVHIVTIKGNLFFYDLFYNLLGKKVVVMECCLRGSWSLESGYSTLKFSLYWLTLIIGDAKMSPNSMCWKNEETQTVGECIHCSDYEEVSYSSNRASLILSALQNWHMQSGKQNNWTNLIDYHFNVPTSYPLVQYLRCCKQRWGDVRRKLHYSSGYHQSNGIDLKGYFFSC